MKHSQLRVFLSGGLECFSALRNHNNPAVPLTRCFSIMAHYREANPVMHTPTFGMDFPQSFRPDAKGPPPSETFSSSRPELRLLKMQSFNSPLDPRVFENHPELVVEEEENARTTSTQKSLTVSLIGMPNAGKSSLLNALVEAPVAAVSKKINTTKQAIDGILMVGDTQIIFNDLPGIAAPVTKKLPLELVQTAWENVLKSDLILLVVDAKLRLSQTVLNMISKISDATPSVPAEETSANLFSDDGRIHPTDPASTADVSKTPPLLKQPVALVFNKMDQVQNKKHYNDFLIRASQIVRANSFVDVFYLSAKSRRRSSEENDSEGGSTHHDGNHEEVERLKQYLVSQALARPWKYPATLKTPASYARLAQEHIRSYLFNHVHQELPYKLVVQIAGWKEFRSKEGSPVSRIFVEIFATNDAAAKAVVGVSGNNVKQLTTVVPPIIEEAFRANGLARRVQLQVQVIVLKNKDTLPENELA